MTAIDDLIERVESGEGADTDLELELWGTIGGVGPGTLTSLDKVVALIEHKLPGADWKMHAGAGSAHVTIGQQSSYAWTPSRALLAALLKALDHGR